MPEQGSTEEEAVLREVARVTAQPERRPVYLAGPIFGCTDEACMRWRQEARHIVGSVLDPMVRDYRGQEATNAEAIVRGDLADIASCRAVLVNAERASWGTAMEIVYATMFRIPVVAFCSGPVSPWLQVHANAVYASQDDAIAAVSAIP